MKSNSPVLELRVAITSKEYDRLIHFYCDALGLEPSQQWNNGQGQALVFDMGKATLEVFDESQAETVDQFEVGKRISGPIRFALLVPDLKSAMDRMLAHGANLIHPLVLTPWGDTNVRFQDPDGLQITLFQPSENKL
jgi:methylmalonyl-CoA/ethylmalonyl-CoA epimerase